VRSPTFAAFAPGYIAEASEVSPPDGDAFVDPTVLRMRFLPTRTEKCRLLPSGISVAASQKAPRFDAAVQRYLRALGCSPQDRL
jgi:hypothetical protein